ncbi:MAG: hypothetical protein ACI8YQ_000075 [Polaribacter sp.]|jgi:hypothetical protein
MLHENLSFPIGRFTEPATYSSETIASYIAQIASLPQRLEAITAEMTEEQLGTPYRPDGWTARQVVHHIADSHINSYTRFKLALTEDNPAIRPYDEVAWAKLPDGKSAPIESSLNLISALHKRWALVLQQLDSVQWQRTFFHPASKDIWRLEYALAFYAWHGEHHLNHIKISAQ